MATRTAYRIRNLLRTRGYEIVRSERSSNLLALHLSHLLPRYGINCVLDVGAREGEFGWWLRGTGYTGRIVSYEPIAAHVSTLRALAERDGNWEVRPYALGAEDTTAALNVTQLTHFSSFREPGELAAASYTEETRVVGRPEVAVHRLDGVFDDAVAGIDDPRVYLKLDTQGWDLEVLRGAEGCLDRVTALQSEMSFRALYVDMPSFAEAWDAVSGYGFEMSGVFPITVGRDLRLIEADCVAVRPGGALSRS